SAPSPAVNYKLVWILGYIRIQIIHQHPQGCLLVPAFAGTLAAVRRMNDSSSTHSFLSSPSKSPPRIASVTRAISPESERSSVSGDVVNARWMREHTRFIDQRRSRDVRNHEAGLHTRLSRQKCRQPFVLVWIKQSICPAFAHAHQIGNCNCRVIERKREWRAMKIAAGNHFIALCEHQRIIGGGCGFN